MVEKKSWRDYLDSVQAGESSENQKTSTWRDYVSEKTGTVDTSKSGWRGQLDHAITNVAGNQITTQVNNWLTNHNNYIKGYQDRYSGRKYTYEDAYVSDSAAWLDTITKQKSEYDTEADNILSYLDQYADYLDSKWVDDVKKTITDARNTQNLIIENATKDNEYWSNWENEDAYKYYQRVDGYNKKYSGMTPDEISSIIVDMEDGEEKDWLSSYKSQQELNSWASVTENEDFAANSGYVSNVKYGLLGKPSFTDNLYAYVNNPTVEDKRPLGVGEVDARYLIEAEDSMYKWDTPLRNRDSSYVRDALSYMTDEEVAIYNYYYATQGADKAREYLDLLVDTFNARKDKDTAEKVAKVASEHPVLASLLSVGTSLGSGFEYVGDVIEYAGDKVLGKDTSLGTNEASIITNAVRNTVAEKVDWEIGNWDAFDFLYNTTMSGVDSIASSMFGGLGGTVLGLSAAAQGTNDALNRGMSDGQAFWNGLFSGVFEGLFETVSLGQFNRLKEIAPNGVKDIIKNLGKSMLVNASEETLTEIANIAYDTLINGEFANYTLEELQNGAWKDALLQVIEAGASGALMGMGMSAVGSTIGYANGNQQAIQQYGDKTDILIQEGLGNDVNSESYKLAQKYQGKVDSGKSLTGAQIRNLLSANQEQITTNDMKKIQKAAEARLTALGQTEDLSKVAELATKWATGQDLTRAEKRLLTTSQYGSRVANELLPSNIDSGKYSTEWAEEIGTRSVNAKSYNKKAIRTILDAMASAEDPATYKSLEDRVGGESSFGVSKSGQATIRETGEAISIENVEVVGIDKGDMSLQVDGKEVKASDIDFADESQSYLFDAVSKIEHITPGAATAIIRDYNPTTGQTMGEYLNGIDEGYTYGYYGYSEADLKAGSFAPKLTSEQMMSAYKLGQSARKISDTSKTEAIKRMRTAVEAEAEKATADDVVVSKKEKTTQQNAKNLTVTYNKGGGKVVDIDKAGIKDAKRSGAVEVAKILHKMGLGTKVEFFSSYLSTDANGNEIRVFLDDNGVEQRAYSGVYRKSDGTIRIDLEAYNGRGLTLNALSHELTHFIQQWSAEKYQVLADFLIKSYEKTDMTMHERVLKEQARLEKIRGKEVSYDEAFDEVVANAMSKMFDDGKLVEKLTELRAEDESLARKLWEGFKKIMSKFLGIYENESALFKDAADLVEMKETFKQLQNMFAEALVEASENHQASQQIGLEIDMQTESVSPAVMNSEHTWTESDYVQERDKAAKEIAKAIGVSEKKAKDYIDSINSIAKMIAEDRSRLDYFSSPGRSSFVDNAEYGGSFDFSTLCKKRRLLTGTFTAIQKALPNTALTADEILDIRNRMKEANLEVSCGLCYVEGSRANMGQFAKEFLRLYKQYYPDAWQPNMADVNTPEGIEWVRINHPECYEQYEYFWNHYGTLKDGDKNLFASQQKPKLYQLHTEYKSEILQKFKGDDKVEDKNLNGGIRLQSFSDFEIVHLIDAMQIIMDMSRVGLAGQAYTKVPDFAWALGDTGLKINLSLIAKGVDADGKLIFDDVEGMPIADAMKLRDRYSKNVGTILVAFNDEQLLAAMADDRVDFIIPFHRSQWKKSQYEAMGLPAKTKDYTFMQNEKYINPQFHEYRGRMVKDKASNYMPNEYWDFSKSGKENAVAYLEMCARNNKRPKFYKLLQNNGDGSYSLKADGSTDGYWKLLIDFKMYDNEGVGSPQMAVKPEFNMEEAKRMLNDYKGGHSTFPVAKGIVDSFVKDYKASHKGEQYSSQETDLDSDGNRLTKAQQEFFKDSMVRDASGNLLVMYHGTKNGDFTVFDRTKAGKRTGFSVYGKGNYFTVFENGAEHYGSRVIPAYLKIANPIITSAKSGAFNADVAEVLGVKATEISTQTISERIKEAGYDGVIVYGVGEDEGNIVICVAYESAQIKEVSNKNPTSDPDIRYSSHETDVDSKAHPYSYDTLVSKPDMVVTEVDVNIPNNRADLVHQAKQNAAKVGRFDPKTGSVSVYVNDVGADVVIGTQGLKHGLEARREENSIVTLKAGEILKNSIRINELTPKRDDANGSYVLVGVAADNNGSFYIVRSVVNQFSYNLISMDVLYAINAKKGNRLRSMRPGFQGPVTDSTISVAELLDLVNQYFPDVLPEDVLKHYGYDARPDGVLGKDALYSEHETDSSNRSLLANAFEGITQNSVEYKMLQDYKSHIKELNELESKLSDLNAEIREIRFGTTGARDTARLTQLENEAKQVAKEINRYDKRLLSLEASEPLRKVVDRERKKEATKTKDHVKEIQQNKKVRAEQTELRHKIRKAIRDLDKILNRGNKKLNVKEELQPVVTKALQAAEILFTDNYGNYDMLRNGLGVDLSDAEEALVNTFTKMLKDIDKMPTDSYEGWQARQEAENRLNIKMSKLKDVFARERKRLNNTTVSSILGELADAYATLNDSTLSYVQGAYSEPVYNFLKNLQSEVGGTIVKDMTKNQLEHIYAAYRMVLETVRNANKMFNEELKQSREQLGNAVIQEVREAGGVHLLGTKTGDAVSQFNWNNLKPIWVGDRIGSETFGRLMHGLFKGQYNFAKDIDEVRRFKLEMDSKYKPRDWDAEKLYAFESSTGKEFSLNLQQIMSLYAFSKREQAYSHLISGGFVFEENSTVIVEKNGIKKTYIHKGATSYKLNVATLNRIVNSLTAEQMAYVDEMQAYLSDVMGAKGNEVSMKLYGIEMFKEKFYFPLRSSGAYMEKAKEAEMKKEQGQINLVNSGFTHSVKPEAKNPIVLSGFMDVWAEHSNEMSMYHSMVLPMEDFRKVYNYTTIHDENYDSASVYQTIQDAYGKAATNYIDQLYRELNAGATVDPRETPYKKLISNFKKAAVMLSASVVVQQFSSVGRAWAVIDPKYFTGTKVNSDTKLSAVEEMKKYAPVAIIKEMGGFDTGTKGNAKAYIMAEQYGKGERLKGFVKDEQYRGDIMGILPAKADEKTWIAIWEAAKRETKANNPKIDVKSEEFLKLAGERFSECIEKTQVYDSVLARSANMRSKGGLMQMATAFMAEPTTTVNLLENAIRKGDAKHIARAFGSVAVSIVLNNALASIVYAMRDDDEDETLMEKYFQSLTSGLIDDINPMSYYPFLKDVYSLFQGYDVERTDMSVIADVRDALKKAVSLLGKDTSDMDDEELAAHYKQVNEVFMGILDAGCSAFGVPVKNIRRDASGLINALVTAQKDLTERDNSWLSFWDKVGSAVKDTIPVLAWTKDKAKTDKLYDAIVSGDEAYLARLKSTYKAEEEFTSAVSTGIRDAYSSGFLDEAGAEKMLQEYAGKDEEEAASKVSYWAFCEEHQEYKDVFTEANVAKYHEFAEPDNISVDVYVQFITGTKGLKTKYDEWGDVELSEREQVLDVINALPLTWQQKDALYLAYGYKESTIWDVPW